MKRFVLAAGLVFATAVMANAQTQAPPAGAQAPANVDPANTLVIELATGKVLIKLRPDLAPKHVARVKQLAKEGFYNGLKWHRVITGFMAQTGDPRGTGEGGSKYGNLPPNSRPSRTSAGPWAQRERMIPIPPTASSSSASRTWGAPDLPTSTRFGAT